MVEKDKNYKIKYKRLNFYERQQIENLSRMGLSGRQIALTVNRGNTSIREELRRVNPYNAVEAQRISDQIHQNKKLKASEKNIGRKCLIKNYDLQLRIESLEMQVQILSETLMELNNDRKNKKL